MGLHTGSGFVSGKRRRFSPDREMRSQAESEGRISCRFEEGKAAKQLPGGEGT